mmetsp:Transcript_6895/g.8988  ORF Transcript_6895/g.8988 Transcript_6895/m.8988 type:complete len:81 (-) Transcript_6895:22-264(-)
MLIEIASSGERKRRCMTCLWICLCDCPVNASSNTECYRTDSRNAKTYNQRNTLSVCGHDPNANTVITFFKDVELGNAQIM